MIGRWRVAVALLALAAGAALSGLLLLEHHGERRAVAAVSEVCGAGEESGCALVSRSPYATVRGVPLAAVGLFFYTSLALLLLLALLAGPTGIDAAAAVALIALLAALAVDAVLLGIQAFAIRAFCKVCLLTYLLNAVAAAVLFQALRARRAVGQAVRTMDGRLVLAGWAFGSLALAAGVLGSEQALSLRERGRTASILGAPASPAPPVLPSPRPSPLSSAAAGAPVPPDAQRWQEEARMAQEQARRLQEILDDPKKLDQYFTDKAAREYEQGPVRNLDVTGVPFKGPADAPVRVVEFSDFLCPFCRQLAAGFAGFMPQSGNRVAVYYKNYPLDQSCNPSLKAMVHPGACALALGGLCAQDQGKFWPYHDKVYASPPSNPSAKDVARIGGEAGLNGAALESCMLSPKTRERLTGQIAEANAAGVHSTPTVFINGRQLPRINDFIQMVDKEFARLGLPPLPPPRAAAGPGRD
jgi:serine/threonine-protein kinase